MATAAEGLEAEDFPVVEVSLLKNNNNSVFVKWDEDVSTQVRVSADADYSAWFRAVDAMGKEPFMKTFGNLLLCDGGVLTIESKKKYRIQAPRDVFNPRSRPREESIKLEAEKAAQQILAKRRRCEPPERILSYVSKSHAFADGKINERISFGNNFFFDLVDPVTTTAFRDAAPEFGKDENKVHHTYFLREAAKLVNSALASGRTISQQLLWTKAGHWLSLDDRTVVGVEPDFATTGVDMSRKNADGSQFYVGKEEEGSEKPSKYDVALTFE